MPVLTDVHEIDEIEAVAAVVDVLQTPAFLCRQTDFIHACARSGKPVNIKKGQFLAPRDMKNVVDKARDAAREAGLSDDSFMVCERGASFGYNNLVSDMRSLAIMRETGARSCSTPRTRCSCRAGRAASRGGQREFVPVLARAAVATASPACSWRRIRTRQARNVRRSERGAAAQHGGAAGDARRARSRREERAVPRERFQLTLAVRHASQFRSTAIPQ